MGLVGLWVWLGILGRQTAGNPTGIPNGGMLNWGCQKGREPPMSDYAYAQRVATLKRRKADLYAALSNLTPDEMTAYGAYRKAMMSGEVSA